MIIGVNIATNRKNIFKGTKRERKEMEAKKDLENKRQQEEETRVITRSQNKEW